jgi:hypothetical protein
MLLDSVAGLLESDATRRVSRRPLIAQPRYFGGLPINRCRRQSACSAHIRPR